MKSLLLLAALTTPPLSFVSIDCTQYGQPGEPYLIMSHLGTGVTVPVRTLHHHPEAMTLLEDIEAVVHERWIDPRCQWIKS